MDYNIIKFHEFGNHEGKLVSLEEEQNIPFKIKRVYYIWGTAKNVVRGKHAHKNLEQVIICMRGDCDFILDDGKDRITVHMDNPSVGLHIKNNIWREYTNFSDDCVVAVIASEHYDADDYIHSYEEFKVLVGASK